MNNQPVLYDSLKTILRHMDANLRINMSQRMPSICATERAVPLKIQFLSFSNNTVEINDVHYKLGIYRNSPNRDVPQFVQIENAHGGVSHDFDRFGFEIPNDSNPILPGDVSIRNEDEQVVRTDTDQWEEHYQTLLTRSENLLRIIAKKESGNRAWTSEYREDNKEYHQYNAIYAREKLKPFHCKRHNLPRPFNCYIQLSVMKYGKAKPLQRLAYTRKLYEAVKQFNHILFANRPAIRASKLVCLHNHVYRTPVGFKISANQLAVEQSHIASIATMIEGDVNILQVSESGNAASWWQHNLVQNANELITEDAPLVEQSALMLRTLRNKIIRFKSNRQMTAGQYCELVESWMSVKREVGSQLLVRFFLENDRSILLETIESRTEVIKKEKRCTRIRSKHGAHIEAFLDKSIFHAWKAKFEIIEN